MSTHSACATCATERRTGQINMTVSCMWGGEGEEGANGVGGQGLPALQSALGGGWGVDSVWAGVKERIKGWHCVFRRCWASGTQADISRCGKAANVFLHVRGLVLSQKV